MKNFFGKYTKGSSFISSKSDNDHFSDLNINKVKKNILKNLKKMGIKKKDLFGKVIMNVGSGREALGFLQFNPKMIYHYDISSINIRDFKNEISKKSINKYIKTKQLDLSKDKLPTEKFDFIYLHGIIQHVSHVGLAIINLSNSLKTNGKIWFYFYRPGSLSILLGSIQRFLLKNIKINKFYKELKRSNNMYYIHSVMDDCYVPNRQLFYPNQYKKNLMLRSVQLRMDFPFDFRNSYGWHQDNAYDKFNLQSKNSAILLIPLVNTDVKNGTIVIKPGSENSTFNYSRKVKTGNKYESEQILVKNKYLKKYDSKSINMIKNNCLATYGGLFHRSGENKSDHIRFTIVARYNNILSKDFLFYRELNNFN